MAKAKKTETGKIKVTLVKSTIACLPNHKKSLILHRSNRACDKVTLLSGDFGFRI